MIAKPNPIPKQETRMAQDRLDQIVLEARRNAEKRDAGYRAQALKLFPWVCGRCGRAFTHSNLQLLEVLY